MDQTMFWEAIKGSFRKLGIKTQMKNFVMFLVYLCAVSATTELILSFILPMKENRTLMVWVSIFLWFTVLFANFAESLAEGKGKASVTFLKNTKENTKARVLEKPELDSKFQMIDAKELKKGDVVLVKAKEQIPLDGEVILGIASVDESAITGESAPVIRESGGDRNSVTGGTTVISDWIIVRITVSPGESFLDHMIKMIEGATRKKTPNEKALDIFLIALSIIFIFVMISFAIFQIYSAKANHMEYQVSFISMISLFVCLIPTTIGALLSSIGIAGMTRLNSKKVLAKSGRAIEAAGDIDILLMDKTGTITLGNREAYEFYPEVNVEKKELAYYASLASLSDETPEGRSIVVLAKKQFDIRPKDIQEKQAKFIEFTAVTKMSGVDIGDLKIRKGTPIKIKEYLQQYKLEISKETEEKIKEIANEGGTPLLVASNEKVYGTIYLKDRIKGGIKEKFEDLRKMGIKTIMITGDNEMTAHAIAKEAGVDDFLAEATPETKLNLIKEYQSQGHLVAMTGDGTNDAPALAAADVAVSMNSGTMAAKEAGNMIDLDSNPTKLIEVVKVGKQLLMTRGALTTFSIANDIAKYFAIIPSLLYEIYPQLSVFNLMKLSSPESAILSAIIFNTCIILLLIPIALKGVKYKEAPSDEILKRNLFVYGLGGMITPFIGIKLIDLVVARLI